MTFFKKLKEKMTGESKETTEKYKEGLSKTRKSFSGRLNEIMARYRKVDDDFFEEVEEVLIGADVGFETVMELVDELKHEVKLRNISDPKEVQEVIVEKLVDIYTGDEELDASVNIQKDLTVILFVGVNGVGKTTTIGKLAHKYKEEGKKSCPCSRRYIPCRRH